MDFQPPDDGVCVILILPSVRIERSYDDILESYDDLKERARRNHIDLVGDWGVIR